MASLTYPYIIGSDKKYRALADLGLALPALDKSQIMSNLPDLIPTDYLALLAEKWSVTGYDGWLLAESLDAKRNLIKRAVNLHRYKGTPWAMREIIRQLGFGEVDIIEGLHDRKHNGEIKRDGTFVHGSTDYWAHYEVVLKQAVTNDQAALLRNTLRYFAPARCILTQLDYQQVAIRHNGVALRNGTYNHGTA